ncbi:unnamed protein product [Clonostachys rhizophaga]|uniref:Anaphase-promoting complex subunit 11 RING-H2 finger domain-containing protein n=1 Tax=Clonostachys rhizophaga TaxID=160324 RepID=A0A9N9W1B5_9HYPO|nr:unnamed protein product [Clonostachys rhizophaga]
MKVTIQKWNTVATWRWDIPEEDVCGICQVHFDGTCPTCKYPGDDCQLCEPNPCHNADSARHCIMEWIKQESSRGQCPMCRQRSYCCASLSSRIVVSDLVPAFEWADQNNESAGQIE